MAGQISAPIRGRVVDRVGDPIEGAWVSFQPRDARAAFAFAENVNGTIALSVLTGTDGRFVASGLAADGTWDVHAWHPDYSRGAGIAARGNRDLDQELPPIVLGEGFLVAGQVLLPDGAPAPAATIEIRADGYQGVPSAEADRLGRLAATVSDANGEFQFAGLGSGAWTVRAQLDGFGAAWLRPLVLTDGRTPAPLRLQLSPEFRYSGVVIDESGAVVADVGLSLHPVQAGDGPEVSTRSDATGRFSFRGVGEGEWQLRIDAPGFLAVRPLTLSESSEDLKVVLERAGLVRGRVIGPAGSGIVQIEVWASTRGQAPYRAAAAAPIPAAADGSFQFTPPPVGSHVLLLRAAGAASTWSAPFQAGPQQTDLGEIRMTVGATVRGRAVAGDGSPLAGVRVQAREAGWSPSSGNDFFGAAAGAAHVVPPATALSDAEGNFVLPDLSPSVGALSFESPRIATLVVPVNLAVGGRVDLAAVVLDLAAELEVMVQRADGSPLAGGTILVQRDGVSFGAQTALLDAHGTAILVGLASGDWWVSAMAGGSAFGRASSRQSVWLRPGARERLTIRLEAR